jgi:DnaK suppressor protein
MRREQQEHYRQRLLEMAARLKNDEAGVASDALRQAGGETSGNLSNVPMHLADFGTDAVVTSAAAG